MKVLSSIPDTREAVAAIRDAGLSPAFVPTMGNLHEGHLDLVRAARASGHAVVVSIFVNPLQFGRGEDLDSYPRTPENDQRMLEDAGVEVLFLPGVIDMYPVPLNEQTTVEVPGISSLHCGASRPGHFRGVATVVCKLLNIVQADAAFFGEKDFQQLAIIRQMTRDLCLPVRIEGVPIRRDPDGLAMSSRNGYLNEKQRRTAPALYQELCRLAENISATEQSFTELTAHSRKRLDETGFQTDYLNVCRQTDLLPATRSDQDLVILAAAWLGKTRLIDNVTLSSK